MSGPLLRNTLFLFESVVRKVSLFAKHFQTKYHIIPQYYLLESSFIAILSFRYNGFCHLLICWFIISLKAQLIDLLCVGQQSLKVFFCMIMCWFMVCVNDPWNLSHVMASPFSSFSLRSPLVVFVFSLIACSSHFVLFNLLLDRFPLR